MVLASDRRGYAYAPRLLGLAPDGRQVVSYVDGEADAYPLAPDLHRRAERLFCDAYGPIAWAEIVDAPAAGSSSSWNSCEQRRPT